MNNSSRTTLFVMALCLMGCELNSAALLSEQRQLFSQSSQKQTTIRLSSEKADDIPIVIAVSPVALSLTQNQPVHFYVHLDNVSRQEKVDLLFEHDVTPAAIKDTFSFDSCDPCQNSVQLAPMQSEKLRFTFTWRGESLAIDDDVIRLKLRARAADQKRQL